MNTETAGGDVSEPRTGGAACDGPSVAAYAALFEALSGVANPDAAEMGLALDAVHDPALGLDRSVCLRDVVDTLRSEAARVREASDENKLLAAATAAAADFITREFGKGE